MKHYNQIVSDIKACDAALQEQTAREQATPWFFARRKTDEDWGWGGYDVDAAINAGLDMFGGPTPAVDGFWIAPGHETTHREHEDGNEHPYTVEADRAQWIPLI